MKKVQPINKVWGQLLSDINTLGSEVSPRKSVTRELLGHQTTIDMNQPVVSVFSREMGYRFMCAEAWWILSGKNRVADIKPYSKHIAQFSDDGIMFNGAYGPMLVDQLPYIVESLVKDKETRQSLATIWRPNPRDSKDIPCTVSVQWLIRDGKLHCFDYMRSSDAWLGWVYDVFNFSCVSMWIVLALREHGVDVELGSLKLTPTSQHLYQHNFDASYNVMCNDDGFEVAPVDLSKFGSPDDLVDYLKVVADIKTGQSPGREIDWLGELPHVGMWNEGIENMMPKSSIKLDPSIKLK